MVLIFDFWILNFCFAQQNTEFLKREEKFRDAQKHYAAGKELIQQGNYTAANHEFKKAQGLLEDASLENPLSAGPSHKPPRRRRGDSPSHKPEGSGLPSDKPGGDGDEALSFYLKAIELAPKDINQHYNLALFYLKNKQYKEAAARLEKVIQLNPKDKDAYYNLGVLYESYLGDQKKALDYYARYIKYSPGEEDTLEVKQWMRQLKKELKK